MNRYSAYFYLLNKLYIVVYLYDKNIIITLYYFMIFPTIAFEGYFEKRDAIALRLRLVYTGADPMELTIEAHQR